MLPVFEPAKFGALRLKIQPLLLVVLISAFSGCAAIINQKTAELAENLSNALLNNNDPATVEAGAPAYMLMIDGFINGAPENSALLMAGANIYSAYAGVFVADKERQQRLQRKAMVYAEKALCIEVDTLCHLRGLKVPAIQQRLKAVKPSEVGPIYTLGAVWAGWIQANADNWDAVAELGHVRLLLETAEQLDHTYQRGAVHLYLGGLDTLLPPAMGGKPESGRAHFEQAIALSEGKNLMAKVVLAERYARLVFNRELHDQLLNDVVAADPEAPGLTLMNVLAKQQAKTLLAGGDEYF